MANGFVDINDPSAKATPPATPPSGIDPNARLVSNTPWGGDAGPAFDQPNIGGPSPARTMPMPPGLEQIARQFFNNLPMGNPPRQSYLPYPTPYRPPFSSPLTRGSDEWGRGYWPTETSANWTGDSLAPGLPSPLEANNISINSGRSLGMWASGNVAPYMNNLAQLAQRYAPVLDLVSKGQFSRNMLAARLGNIKAMQAEMEMNQYLGIEKHKKELQETGEIFEMWRNGLLTDEQARDKLLTFARTNHHQNLEDVILNKGVGAAENWIKWEDQHMRAIEAAWTTSRKTSSDGESSYSSEGGDSLGTSDLTETPKGPNFMGPAGAPATTGATPPTTPAAGGGGGGTVASYNKKMGDYFHFNEAGVEAVHQILNGETPERLAAQPKTMQDKMSAAATTMLGDAGKIASGPGTPQEKIDRLRNELDPQLASDVDSIGNYKSSSTGMPVKKRGIVESLVKQIYPDYDATKFKAASRFTDPASVENRDMERAGMAVGNYIQLLAALKDIPEGSSPTKNMYDKWVATHLSGDPKWDRVYEAMRTFAGNIVSLQSLTGTQRVSLIQGMLANMPPTASPRSVRLQAYTDLADVWNSIAGYQQQWENIRPNSLNPAIHEDAWKMWSAILRTNPWTGEVPADAPFQLKNVGKKKSEMSSRVPENEKWDPPTIQVYRDLQAKILAYRSSGDPDQAAQADALETALGTVMMMPLEVPGARDATRSSR